MNVIEIIALYVNGYLSNNQFEDWVYSIDDKLKELIHEDMYYEVISTNYSSKEKVYSIKNTLKRYLLSEHCDEYNKINDGYIERIIEDNRGNDNIINILKQKYIQKDKIEIDCFNINSLMELHKELKNKLDFLQNYVMNLECLREFLQETVLPKELIFNGWSHLVRVIPDDIKKFKEILVKNISNECRVIYKN